MSRETLEAYYAAEYRERVQGSEGPTEKDVRIQTARANHLVEFSQSMVTKVRSCLDIGSSTGILLEAFRKAYGCDGIGIEPGEAYAQYGRDKGFQIVADIQDLPSKYEHHFDMVTMGHTLEHIPNPREYLLELREKWLAPNGHLLVEVPNLYGHHALEQAHLFAFSRDTLSEMLQHAGYDLLHIKVHGYPRSKLIPLYIIALARAGDRVSQQRSVRSSSRGVAARRKLGMRWRWLATTIAGRWAWLPWPETEDE
jgi:SAM-dependent methyltransferase